MNKAEEDILLGVAEKFREGFSTFREELNALVTQSEQLDKKVGSLALGMQQTRELFKQAASSTDGVSLGIDNIIKGLRELRKRLVA